MIGNVDITRLADKISPKPDGEDVLRLRVGVIEALNADGTITVVVDGATLEEPIPVLAGAVVAVGLPVQMLSYRGSLLAIGAVAGAAQSAGLGLWARGQDTANFPGGFTTTPVTVLTSSTATFVPGRVYECRTHGGIGGGVGTWASLAVHRASSGVQLGEFYRYPVTAASTVFNGGGAGVYFRVTANVTSAVRLVAQASAGTMSHVGTTATPRNIEVWDVGDISKFPGVTTW